MIDPASRLQARWLLSLLALCAFAPALPAQAEEEGGPSLAQAERAAFEKMEAGLLKEPEARLRLAREALASLKPLAEDDEALRAALQIAEVGLRRQELRDDEIARYVRAYRRAETEAARRNALLALSDRVIATATAAVQSLDPSKVDSKDVDRILGALAAATAIHDARRGGNTTASQAANLARLGKAVYDLADALGEEDRAKARAAAAKLLTSLAPPLLSEPTAVATAIVTETARLTEEAAGVLRGLADAISTGDAEEVVARAERFEQEILKESYGKAFEKYLRDKVYPKLPFLGPQAMVLTREHEFEDEAQSSNEVGKKILALMPRRRVQVWTNDEGQAARMLVLQVQPVIQISQGVVEIKVWTKVQNDEAGGPPSRFALGHLTGKSPSGQTIDSVQVTYADGEKKTFPSMSSRAYSFRPGPKVIREIVVRHQFAGLGWQEVFAVPGY